MHLTDRIAEFALRECPDDDALRMMRLSVLDWATCGMAGVSESAARLVRNMVLGDGGAGGARVFGGGQVPARGAALVNGVTSHALDYDDTHFAHIGHPSVVVVSAALAVAQDVDATGEAFVQACLAGVEASTRIGVWLGRGHYQMGFHQTGTAGCFGAALAAGRLLGCDAVQMTHAIGLAATRAGGLKSQFGTMGKPYNAGAAAAAGVETAQLAKAGFVSNPVGLEGAQGFGATHGTAGDMSAFDGLGETWLFGEISHKFHACCHGTHAMIEALRGASGQGVEAVEVRTHPRWLNVCDQPEPATGLEAKFSYRLIAAMVLSGHDTTSLGTFSDALANDARLCALRDKVRVVGDEQIAETASVVTLTSAQGTERHEADILAPMSLAMRKEKLLAKAEALIGADAAPLEAAVLRGDSVEMAGLSAALGQEH